MNNTLLDVILNLDSAKLAAYKSEVVCPDSASAVANIAQVPTFEGEFAAISNIRAATDWVALAIIFLLIIDVIIFWRMRQHSGKFVANIDSYLSGQLNSGMNWDIGNVYYFITGIAGYTSVFLCANLFLKGELPNIYHTLLIFIAVIMVKLILCSSFAKIFFYNTKYSMLRLQSIFYGFNGHLGLMACLFLIFTPLSFSYIVLIIYSVIAIVVLFGLFFAIYVKFFGNLKLFFEYMLYLCTLEILPLAVSVKMLRQL